MTPFHVHVQTTLHAFRDLSNEWSSLHALALCHASEKEPHFRSSRQLDVPFVIGGLQPIPEFDPVGIQWGDIGNRCIYIGIYDQKGFKLFVINTLF